MRSFQAFIHIIHRSVFRYFSTKLLIEFDFITQLENFTHLITMCLVNFDTNIKLIYIVYFSPEKDNCLENTACGPGGKCINTNTGYNCQCATGFTGATCDGKATNSLRG